MRLFFLLITTSLQKTTSGNALTFLQQTNRGNSKEQQRLMFNSWNEELDCNSCFCSMTLVSALSCPLYLFCFNTRKAQLSLNQASVNSSCSGVCAWKSASAILGYCDRVGEFVSQEVILSSFVQYRRDGCVDIRLLSSCGRLHQPVVVNLLCTADLNLFVLFCRVACLSRHMDC